MGVLIKMEKQQLEKYIEEYGRDIYLFCKRLTGNKSTADDLYQETFLKLWNWIMSMMRRTRKAICLVLRQICGKISTASRCGEKEL